MVDETPLNTLVIIAMKLLVPLFGMLRISKKLQRTSQSENSLSLGKIIMPLRLALLGSLNGPAVYDIIEILGKKEVFKRIDSAIKNFIGK